LTADLQRAGVETWYSGWDILPGDRFPEEINRGLEWCEFFVIVLSKSSLSRAWVQTELYAALVRQQSGNLRKIIPVKIEKHGRLPAIFEPLHVEDLSPEHYIQGLTRVLDSLFSSAASSETAPSGRQGGTTLFSPSGHSTETRTGTWTSILSLALILLLGSSLFAQTRSQNLVTAALLQLAVGWSLAAIVWVFFERVDNLLTPSTKFEISGWLIGLNVSTKIAPWPDTFLSIFYRVFGRDALSFRCFLSSGIASYSLAVVVILISLANGPSNPYAAISVLHDVAPKLLMVALFTNVLPDYLALLVTRGILLLLRRSRNGLVWLFLLVVDLAATAAIGIALWMFMFLLTFGVWGEYYDAALEATPIARPDASLAEPTEVVLATLFDYSFYLWFCPVFRTSIWLWLYVTSGYLLKVARRVQIGFDWFTRIFDIEKQPLAAVGLVAGLLVAIVYWTAVIISRIAA